MVKITLNKKGGDVDRRFFWNKLGCGYAGCHPEYNRKTTCKNQNKKEIRNENINNHSCADTIGYVQRTGSMVR